MKSLIDAIKGEVNSPRVDDYLHFSTDLQNARHTCISWVHGIPLVDKPWMNTFPLLQGTAVHEYVHTVMLNQDKWKYYSEKSITISDRKYPWTGTADAYSTLMRTGRNTKCAAGRQFPRRTQSSLSRCGAGRCHIYRSAKWHTDGDRWRSGGDTYGASFRGDAFWGSVYQRHYGY